MREFGRGQIGFVSRRNANLGIASGESRDDHFPASQVQFGKNVVKQEHGRLTQRVAQKVELRQLHGDNSKALLAS